MPPRKNKAAVRRRAPVQHGEVWSDFTKWVKGAARTVAKGVKDNKLISRGLSLVSGVGGTIASKVAGAVGYGKRKAKAKPKTVRTQAGGGKMSMTLL